MGDQRSIPDMVLSKLRNNGVNQKTLIELEGHNMQRKQAICLNDWRWENEIMVEYEIRDD
jgi:hypothetical protein